MKEKKCKAFWGSRESCMRSDELPPVMSLSGEVGLWVIKAPCFQKAMTHYGFIMGTLQTNGQSQYSRTTAVALSFPCILYLF